MLVEWLDAVADIDSDGPAEVAGGLMLLPSVGFHVRNGTDPSGTRFVVLAREYFEDEGVVRVRDTHTIPTGWIRKWSVTGKPTQIWPENGEETET